MTNDDDTGVTGTTTSQIPSDLPTTRPDADGRVLPTLGLGCNNFGHNPFGTFIGYDRSRRVIHAALDQGIRAFDTADVYGQGESERYLGRALKGHDRSSMFIATKFGYEMPGAPEGVSHGSPAYVRWAVESSLRRLEVDYLDLVALHRADPQTPIELTLASLNVLMQEGKVRSIGCSMFSAEQLRTATLVARRESLPRLSSCMMHYNVLERANERSAIPACIELGITVLPFFPLEGGLLTGKYRRDRPNEGDGRHRDAAEVSPEMWQRLTELEQIADGLGVSLLELSLGGLAAFAGVGTVFVGATTPAQVIANTQAIRWIPSAEDIASLRSMPGCDAPNDLMEGRAT